VSERCNRGDLFVLPRWESKNRRRNEKRTRISCSCSALCVSTLFQSNNARIPTSYRQVPTWLNFLQTNSERVAFSKYGKRADRFSKLGKILATVPSRCTGDAKAGTVIPDKQLHVAAVDSRPVWRPCHRAVAVGSAARGAQPAPGRVAPALPVPVRSRSGARRRLRQVPPVTGPRGAPHRLAAHIDRSSRAAPARRARHTAGPACRRPRDRLGSASIGGRQPVRQRAGGRTSRSG
jgi:hypothetical protein